MVGLKSGWKPLALQAVAGSGEAAQAQEQMGSWGSPGWLQVEGLTGEWEGLPWAPTTLCFQASTLWAHMLPEDLYLLSGWCAGSYPLSTPPLHLWKDLQA